MRLEKFLFCESVRQELSGQLTLVGLFPTDLVGLGPRIMPSVPFVLPTLACVVVLDQMRGIGRMRVQCEVKFGSEVVQRSPAFTAERPKPTDSHHTLNISFSPFTGPDFGEYVFKVTVEAGRETTSFSRRLKIEQAGAELPPASQTH